MFDQIPQLSRFAIVLLVLAVIWGLCHLVSHFAFPSGHFFYRTTVVVETPEGIRTGSAVRKINYHRELNILEAGGKHYNLARGQAVVVDLGERGKLFALMEGIGGPDYGHQIILDSFPAREKTASGARVALTPNEYPTLVRFRNLNDPKTVELIFPGAVPTKLGNGLPCKQCIGIADAFGNGVRIKEITMEIVDEQPVTTGIIAALPWLSTTYGHLSGSTMAFTDELYDTLETRAFVVGARQ